MKIVTLKLCVVATGAVVFYGGPRLLGIDGTAVEAFCGRMAVMIGLSYLADWLVGK